MALITRMLFVVFALAALPASASFHLWTMTELYSNADGSVQFLEMRALTSSEQFFNGHTLTSTVNGVTKTFTATRDLPGDSAGHSVLFATQGFAALPGGVQPDFILPNGFFSTTGGTIVWGEGAVFWVHGALPTNGDDAIDRNGSVVSNSPQNFAGQTGHVSSKPSGGGNDSKVNVQGLWWASPAASENGWGVNLTLQGDIVFATWFTYDTDGTGLWLVMSNGQRQSGTNTYSGQLFRTTGPAFNASPWNPQLVTVTPVGNATFSFTDANNGTFSYTVNGISQTKAITRQVYSSPLPTCDDNSSSSTDNFQALWWAGITENGWGVNVTQQGNILFVTWFTYDATGKGLWLVGSNVARTGTNTFSGQLFRTTGPAFNSTPFNPASVTVTPVGTVTFTFSDSNNGTFAYTVNGVSQTKPITRQVFSTPVTVCR